MSLQPYSKHELHVIDTWVLPSILGQKSYVAPRAERLHLGLEQLAFYQSILVELKPQVSLEIGTFEGDTFAIMAKHSERTISIDPDPAVRERLSPSFRNAEFHVGSSDDVLPELISKFNRDRTALEFVFIDGNHATDFVRRDINNILKYKPVSKTIVLMHDSFNPNCRDGIVTADWKSCPHCHFVEIDAVPGLVHPNTSCRGEMWGGVAMAVLLPESRTAELVVRQTHQLTYQAAKIAQKKEGIYQKIIGRFGFT
jgi:hypothetical protein